MIDLADGSVHSVQATLEVVSEHAYWYVDDTLSVPVEALQASAEAYESSVHPVVTRFFGDIWNPGVDNDPRLTVLNSDLGANIAGYFDCQNEYTRETHPHSNEREMIFMDPRKTAPGTPDYLGVLAHEFQHAVHWNYDPGEDTWINEGMSETAKDLAGYGADFIGFFLSNPATQLNHWPEEVGRSAPDYGAATLFMLFLAEHYGGNEGLDLLVREPLDGINGVESYLAPYGKTFLDVFKDWVVANYLDASEGPYSYGGRTVRVRDIERMSTFGEKSEVLPQFSARYIDLRLESGDALVEFQGDSVVSQVATQCRSGRHCWWGNRGDSIDSTLTREFDLSGLSEATLEFWTWFHIEEDWDYAYVEVSVDEGATWTTLAGAHTTSENPLGNNYGHGFTGRSEGWVQEKIDLSSYAGQRVLVRFEHITDDSVYTDGFVIDDLAIPQLGFFDDAEGDAGWDARGFLRIDNKLHQQYVVQVIEQRADGRDVVRQMSIDEDRKGRILVRGFGEQLSNAVIVVSPVTRDTHQLARYTIAVGPGG